MAGPGTEPGLLALDSNAIPTALRGLAHAYEKSTQTVGGWIYAIMAYTWFSIALTFVRPLGECEGREWGGGGGGWGEGCKKPRPTPSVPYKC